MIPRPRKLNIVYKYQIHVNVHILLNTMEHVKKLDVDMLSYDDICATS